MKWSAWEGEFVRATHEGVHQGLRVICGMSAQRGFDFAASRYPELAWFAGSDSVVPAANAAKSNHSLSYRFHQQNPVGHLPRNVHDNGDPKHHAKR